MRSVVSTTFKNFFRLMPTLIFVLSSLGSGPGRASEERVERSMASLQKQSQSVTESEPQRPADPQVKIVLQKMAAAGIGRPATVEDVRKAYLFYPKLSGTPEHVFRVEDREIPGPANKIRIRVYTPSPTRDSPILVFFHGGGFVAGNLDTYESPLRSVANRCECIVVSVAYRLAPEDKYPAAPEDAYAATQ